MFEAPPEIIEWFRGLTDKQLVEFFYGAVQGRRIFGADEDYLREHLVLAHATQMRDYTSPGNSEYDPWEPWKISVLALHDASEYGSGWDDTAPLCQGGVSHCGNEVVCYAKRAICPVCGEPVYCS